MITARSGSQLFSGRLDPAYAPFRFPSHGCLTLVMETQDAFDVCHSVLFFIFICIFFFFARVSAIFAEMATEAKSTAHGCRFRSFLSRSVCSVETMMQSFSGALIGKNAKIENLEVFLATMNKMHPGRQKLIELMWLF